VPVDMAPTITGPRTRGQLHVEVFSNLVYESNVETRVGLLRRNVDVAKRISNRHFLFFCITCSVVRQGKVCIAAEGGHL
jgi:hypothetical protein